jgi:hypothetical protein
VTIKWTTKDVVAAFEKAMKSSPPGERGVFRKGFDAFMEGRSNGGQGNGNGQGTPLTPRPQ